MKNHYTIALLAILAILLNHANLEAVDFLEPFREIGEGAEAVGEKLGIESENKGLSPYVVTRALAKEEERKNKQDAALKKLTAIQNAIEPMKKAVNNSSLFTSWQKASVGMVLTNINNNITKALPFTQASEFRTSDYQAFKIAMNTAWNQMRIILNTINPPIKEKPNLSGKERTALLLQQNLSLSPEKRALLQQLNSISVPIFEISKIYNFDINKP